MRILRRLERRPRKAITVGATSTRAITRFHRDENGYFREEGLESRRP